MTKEKLDNKKTIEEQLDEIKQMHQNEMMEKLLETISNLSEKANAKSYVPTEKERYLFSKIVGIINDLNNWF